MGSKYSRSKSLSSHSSCLWGYPKRKRRVQKSRSPQSDSSGESRSSRNKRHSHSRKHKPRKSHSSHMKDRGSLRGRASLDEDRKGTSGLRESEAFGSVNEVLQQNSRLCASLGYTDSENPFGDSSLNTTFVWLKKRQEDKLKRKLDPAECQRRELEQRRENERVLEKLKLQRKEREIEMQLRERELLRLQRERNRMAMSGWEVNEDQFHLEQTKLRSLIRIRENRARPIDILAAGVIMAYNGKVANQFYELGIEPSMDDPCVILENLDIKKAEELHKDIQGYIYLEKEDNENRTYWEALIVVSESRLDKLRQQQAVPLNASFSAANPVIIAEIEKMLQNKSLKKLESLHKQIEEKLSSGTPVDAEYWEAVIMSLIVWKAKFSLREMHKKIVEKYRAKLHELGKRVPVPRLFLTKLEHSFKSPKKHPLPTLPDSTKKESLCEDKEIAEESPECEPYDPSMSPIPLYSIPESYCYVEVIDIDVFNKSLKLARDMAMKTYLASLGNDSMQTYSTQEQEELVQAIFQETTQSMDMDGDSSTDQNAEPELVFVQSSVDTMPSPDSVEGRALVPSTSNFYYWYDRYRPRKPRYLNRIYTGYEWNKYNQTHYDSDNPPPKVIRGYKFNIFYPDLIDKTVSPTYIREGDTGHPHTAILRFKAGPPYEDIAFRIINREWEYSHKKGFKSSFDKGVLQLWFHFKRHYYRR